MARPPVKTGPSPGQLPFPPIEILFVCTGNICRSPMAEALLRHRSLALGLDLRVASAGLLFEGREAEPGAVAAMAKRGIDLSGHRSRILTPEILQRSDLVLGMEHLHVREASVMSGGSFRTTMTLPELVALGTEVGPRGTEALETWIGWVGAGRSTSDLPTPDLEVPDPMGDSHRAFRRAAARIDELLGQFVALAWPEQQPAGRRAAHRKPTPRSV